MQRKINVTSSWIKCYIMEVNHNTFQLGMQLQHGQFYKLSSGLHAGNISLPSRKLRTLSVMYLTNVSRKLIFIRVAQYLYIYL